MKKFFNKLIVFLPRKLQIQLKGLWNLGYWLRLDKPITFNEKINKRKLDKINELFVICSDKAKCRDYVKNIIGEKYLIPILYIGKDITVEKLGSFGANIVVKSTHGSGNVFIIRDESDSLSLICKSVLESLSEDYGKKTFEHWYSKIEPMIIVEKLLIKTDGNLPEDYKFHIFNNKGNVKVILQVDYDRFIEHTRTFYDEDLNILDLSIKYPNKKIPLIKPDNYENMLYIAKQLSKDFDYVRVDLYNLEGQIYFGELTFAHGSGFEKFDCKKNDYLLGGYWQNE